MDTSGPYNETVAGSRYWFKIVDDKTRKSWDFYGAKKSGIKTHLQELLDKLKAAGIEVKYVRCDNAGEHISDLKKMCEGQYNIKMEYTAPHTPQHNGVVERMFARDANRALAMMLSAGWTKFLQGKLWAEATKTAAVLGNTLPNTRSTVPPDELFYGTPCTIYGSTVEYGRIGYVTNRGTMRGKFKEKATKMIMVGYAENHARDVYRMYNPYSGKIVETRDIHAWADLTKAENDIRLTMAEAFDRQMVLGEDLEEVEAELAADEEELTPQIHLIPEYDEEIATMTALQPAETPMSSAGRIESMIERERTKEDEVHDENETKMDVPPTSILFDSDSDDDEDVIILRKEGDSVEERIVELPTEQTIIENAEEMVEREQKQRTTPLERELKKLGIESPVVIENDEPGTRTRSRTRIAHLVFNTMLTSDPGEPKTFRAAVTGPKKQEWIPSAKSEINNFISRDAWKKFPGTS
ncbi:PIF1-like helicase [Fragilaria crotonensis]|nr:PIF1-like helicase [Fragilaria crotonensis]